MFSFELKIKKGKKDTEFYIVLPNGDKLCKEFPNTKFKEGYDLPLLAQIFKEDLINIFRTHCNIYFKGDYEM